MPEGPSLVFLKNKLKPFEGRVVTAAGGYTDMPVAWLVRKKLLAIRTWGKHLLLCFRDGTVRIHLMLFGSVEVNERKKVNAKLFLQFGKDEINFYVVNTLQICEPLEQVYDWRTDILSDAWDPAHVYTLLQAHEKDTVGDLLMDQQVFTGVGNIIRNEAMFLAKVHPLTKVKDLPPAQARKLIREVHKYALQFLREKKAGTFGDAFHVYQQAECPTDGSPLKKGMLGKTKRKTYYCTNCQVLYHQPAPATKRPAKKHAS